MKSVTKETAHIKYNGIIIGMIALFSLTLIPVLCSAITVVDELLLRLRFSTDFFEALTYRYQVLVNQGRALAILNPILVGITFASDNLLYIGAIRCAVIIGVFSSAAYLLYKIMHNKSLAIFYVVLLFLFMPSVYEHMQPMAFTVDYGVPFMLVMISCIFFYNYCKNTKLSQLVVSAILYLLTISSYEIFITYSLLYCVIAYCVFRESNASKTKGMKDIIKKSAMAILPIAIVGLLYLAAYYICGKLIPNYYSGNTLSFSSADTKDALNVLAVTISSAVPGFFLFNNKHQSFSSGIWQMVQPPHLLWMLIILVCILLTALIIFFALRFKSESAHKLNAKALLIIMLLSATYVLLPNLPYALSAHYRSLLLWDSTMISVTGTFFAYLAIVLLISSILYTLASHIKAAKVIITIAVIFLGCTIQAQNLTMAVGNWQVNNRNAVMESFLQTDFAQDHLSDQSVLAPSLYESNYSLQFTTYDPNYPNYYSYYAKRKSDLNINFVKTTVQSIPSLRLTGVNNPMVLILLPEEGQGANQLYIYSPIRLTDYTIAAGNEQFQLSSYIRDRDLYTYTMALSAMTPIDQILIQPTSYASMLIGPNRSQPGSNFYSAEKLTGWVRMVKDYAWAQSETCTIFHTGNGGHMEFLCASYPELSSDAMISIWFDDILVYNEPFYNWHTITLDAVPKTNVTVRVCISDPLLEGDCEILVSKFQFD